MCSRRTVGGGPPISLHRRAQRDAGPPGWSAPGRIATGGAASGRQTPHELRLLPAGTMWSAGGGPAPTKGLTAPERLTAPRGGSGVDQGHHVVGDVEVGVDVLHVVQVLE